MQGDGGFAAAGGALDHEMDREGMADDDILLRLDGADDILQAVGGDAAQDLLEISLLGDDAGIEKADELTAADGEHALEGELAPDATVRCFVIHGADLAGIIEIGHGGAPVHDDRREGYGIEHAPAAQIPGFRLFAGGDEIQAGEISLAGGQMQLAEAVELDAEELDGDFLLLIRIFLHLHIHAFAGFGAGERLDLPDFAVDGIAGFEEMAVFFQGGRMIRQNGFFHNKKPLLFIYSQRLTAYCACKRVDVHHTGVWGICQPWFLRLTGGLFRFYAGTGRGNGFTENRPRRHPSGV